MSFHRLALLSIAMLVPACMTEAEPSPGTFDALVDVEERCIGCGWGPPVTNTHGLNGLTVSALDTTGQMHDGWRLISVEVLIDRTYVPVYDVVAEDGFLFGTDANANGYAGKDFVGSKWTVELEATSQTVVLGVESFDDDDPAPRYTFTGSSGTPNNEKGYTCVQDLETGEHSVVLFRDLDVDAQSGTHSERANTIYFACVSGAVGKAAQWGYTPWDTDDDTHQTATRAVRADYCGDGDPHTIQGTGLQITDIFQIYEFTDAQKPTEAMWGPSGAQCLGTTRLGEDPQAILCNGAPLPSCDGNDGFGNWPSALIWTKLWN